MIYASDAAGFADTNDVVDANDLDDGDFIRIKPTYILLTFELKGIRRPDFDFYT